MHLNRRDDVNREQGVGWCRLRFTEPKGAAGRRAWLQFDAASRVATMWFNGTRLGEHAGGFFVHGGLYCPVSLVLTDPVHVDLLDDGGPGVYGTTLSADATRATVSVQTRLRVTLRDARGIVRDVLEQPFGIRTFAFDSRGLLLNGRPLTLRGVGYHQDREGKGLAVSREDIAEEVSMILDMGARRECEAAAARADPPELQPCFRGRLVSCERGRLRPQSPGLPRPSAIRPGDGVRRVRRRTLSLVSTGLAGRIWNA